MREVLITRSFITTVVKIKGNEDVMRFPNMYKNQVAPILSAQKMEVESITEELVRYGMSENDFLANARPIIKTIKSEDKSGTEEG